MYLISEFLKPKKVFTRKKSQRNVGMDRKFAWFTADGGGGRIRCLKLIQLKCVAVIESEWIEEEEEGTVALAYTWSSVNNHYQSSFI